MARPETLIPGNCYFSVGFYDNDLVLPMIDTLVYVGQETDRDEGRLWLFKEPESPSSPEEQDPPSEPAAVIGFSDSQLHEIVDFNGYKKNVKAPGDGINHKSAGGPSKKEIALNTDNNY